MDRQVLSEFALDVAAAACEGLADHLKATGAAQRRRRQRIGQLTPSHQRASLRKIKDAQGYRAP